MSVVVFHWKVFSTCWFTVLSRLSTLSSYLCFVSGVILRGRGKQSGKQAYRSVINLFEEHKNRMFVCLFYFNLYLLHLFFFTHSFYNNHNFSVFVSSSDTFYISQLWWYFWSFCPSNSTFLWLWVKQVIPGDF